MGAYLAVGSRIVSIFGRRCLSCSEETACRKIYADVFSAVFDIIVDGEGRGNWKIYCVS